MLDSTHFLNVGTPSGVLTFDHLLWPIFEDGGMKRLQIAKFDGRFDRL